MYIIDTNLLRGLPDGGHLTPLLTGFDLPMIVCVAECMFWCHEGALRPIAIR